jgi:Right handed beta helix region
MSKQRYSSIVRVLMMAWLGYGWLGCNPNHCPANVNEDCREDLKPPADVPCTASAECAAENAMVCNLDIQPSKCVQCTAAEAVACSGKTPVCGEDNSCAGCSKHGDCASLACLPDGACAEESKVAYVAAMDQGGTDNSDCSKATPCLTVAKALIATPARSYVKLSGTLDEAVTISGARKVTMLAAPGAKLTNSMGMASVVTITGDSDLEIYDLEIGGGNKFGISLSDTDQSKLKLVRVKISTNAGAGIDARGGELTVEQSTISDNKGGGIKLDSTRFTLTNNVIVRNGDANSNYGGIQLANLIAGMSRLEYNTVTLNTGKMNTTTGVDCASSDTVAFSNNIVYGNVVSGTGTQISIDPQCTWTYSDIGPTVGTVPGPGTGNLNVIPAFVDAAANNFRPALTSPVIDKADPASVLRFDFSGNLRPLGPGRDLGAYEVK